MADVVCLVGSACSYHHPFIIPYTEPLFLSVSLSHSLTLDFTLSLSLCVCGGGRGGGEVGVCGAGCAGVGDEGRDHPLANVVCLVGSTGSYHQSFIIPCTDSLFLSVSLSHSLLISLSHSRR